MLVTCLVDHQFGDLTEATVQKVTGNEEYRFGDLSKSALKSVTGKEQYKFGDVTKSLFKRMRGDGGKDGTRERRAKE